MGNNKAKLSPSRSMFNLRGGGSARMSQMPPVTILLSVENNISSSLAVFGVN